MNTRKKLRKYITGDNRKSEYIHAAAVVVLVVVIGVMLLIGSRAASPYGSITADKGTTVGVAQKQGCSGAADGSCVVFGSASQPSGGGANMIVGLNEAGNGDTGALNTSKAVKFDRFDYENGESGTVIANSFAKYGVKVDLLLSGPYTNSGGVSTLTNGSGLTNWVNSALLYYQTYCTTTECPMIEVLNEPSGWWFWGTGQSEASIVNDQTNANAYAALVKATYSAFHSTYGANAPKILATVDGYGSANAQDSGSIVGWGMEWWNTNSGTLGNSSSYVDGVVVHPYGGTGTASSSKLGNRTQVTDANTLTGKPVYATEVGWPTDDSGSLPTSVNQTGDSLQWPQSNAAGGNQGDQCDNIYNFIQWARSANYVNAVMIFGYADYGTNAYYGMYDRSGTTAKPGYTSLQAAAQSKSNPCPNPLSY